MNRAHRVVPFCLFLFSLVPPARGQGPENAPGAPIRLRPIDVKKLTAGQPKTVAVIEKTWSLFPVALCWSPDDSRLYVAGTNLLQSTGAPPRGGKATTLWDINFGKVAAMHTVSLASGEVKKEESEPAWAQEYWGWKSAPVSPDHYEIKQEVSGRMETTYSLSGVLVGRPLYPFSGLTNMPKDETLPGSPGRFRDPGREVSLLYPGMTYSWSPPGGRALAFTNEFKLFVVSDDGKTRKKIASGNYTLPAWSNDGKKIAFARATGSGTFGTQNWRILVVDLSGIETRE
jgi:hypothetical protein